MLLADCAGSWPLALSFGTRRKNLCSELTQRIDMFLAHHYGHLEGDVARAQYAQYVAGEAVQMRSEKPVNRKDRIVQVVAKVAVGVGITLDDTTEVFDVEMMGNIVRNERETHAWKVLDGCHETQLDEDLTHAKQQVEDMSRLPMYD